MGIKILWEDGRTPYDVIVDILDAWCINHVYGDMLVTVRMGSQVFDGDNFKPYETSIITTFIGCYNDDWEWANDWWEGEPYVELLGFMPVSDVLFNNVFDLLPDGFYKVTNSEEYLSLMKVEADG